MIAGLVATYTNTDAADLTMALGGLDVGKSGTGMAQVEYRFSSDWSYFRPQSGFFVTQHSGAYIYAGAGYPVSFNEKWSLTPSVSLDYYHNGAGKDLGYDLEFYSQLQLEYLVAAGSKIGLGIGHISNAGIGDSNPGAETVYLSYSVAY